MSRRIGILTLALFVCGGITWWAAAPCPVSGFPEPPSIPEVATAQTIPAPPAHRAEGVFDFYLGSQAEQQIQNALGDPKGVDLEFIDTPLKDAMDFLAHAHKITILIDEQSLTEEGIAIDEPINRTLSGIKLESALKIILEPLGLTHIIEDEVLKVLTIIDADQTRSTRVYHTGYLTQIGIEPEALSKTIQAVVEPAHWRSNQSPTMLAATSEKQFPASWNDERGIAVAIPHQTVQFAGGAKPQPKPAANSIEVLGDMLAVSAPKDVHDQIKGLLIQLDRRWELEHGKK